MRTALALGWQAVFLLEGCCDIFNDKALRAGRGAAFKLPLAHGAEPCSACFAKLALAAYWRPSP